MNIKQYAAPIISAAALFTALGTIHVYGEGYIRHVGEKHFVTRDEVVKKDIREINRQLHHLRLKVKYDEATRSEEGLIEVLEDEKRALEQELGK